MRTLGENWTDELEDFFIPNDMHFSTLIVISAQEQHLVK